MTDNIPRLVLVACTEKAQLEPVILGLAAAFAEAGYQPQVYVDVASPDTSDCMRPVFGLAVRHLDPWTLSPERCRAVFARTASLVDIALVRCDYRPHGLAVQWQLARNINAPVIAVVDAGDLERGIPLLMPDNQLPDGVFVTGVHGHPLEQLKRQALAVAQAPFVGAISRDAVTHAISPDSPPRTLQQVATHLAGHLLEFTSIERLYQLAISRPFDFPPATPRVTLGRPPRIAAAWDEGHHCYLPDALDELQLLGAEIVDFAPSRAESLPEDVDVVLLGSGHLSTEYIRSLAANACLQGSLRAHVCRHKVVYAEGAGAAILCQAVITPEGESIPMTGILPVTLQLVPATPGQEAVEITPERNIWFFRSGTPLRGYLSRTTLFVDGAPEAVVAHHQRGSQPPQPVVIARKNCIASLVHFNFAAVPDLLAGALLATTSVEHQE